MVLACTHFPIMHQKVIQRPRFSPLFLALRLSSQHLPPLSLLLLSLSIPLIIQKRSSSFLLRERKRRCCWERGHGLPWRETLAWPSSPLISPTLLLTRPILTTPSPLHPTPTVLLINNAYLLLLPLPSPSLLETTAAIPQTSQLILLTSWDLAPSVNAVWFLVVISICIGI